MIDAATLGGYLLEELLAYLIQSAGYRLITHPSQDPEELTTNNGGDLLVYGRGGSHQVDVLGEFTYAPAFSQPIRLFVEAKARGRKTPISVVRNAVGTITDVNEAWMINYSANRARRHYRYALFATGGFTADAQNYAVAHQIALVDLSGPEWAGLRDAVQNTAAALLHGLPPDISRFPVRAMRVIVRRVLGTHPDLPIDLSEDYLVGERLGFFEAARGLQEQLEDAIDGALLAFPAGQQVLLARPDSLDRFLRFAASQPVHQVSLMLEREAPGSARTWTVTPVIGPEYVLRMTLPPAVEDRALAESERLAQSLAAKHGLGGRLDIFWDPRGRDANRLPGPRLFRLEFAGADLRRHRR